MILAEKNFDIVIVGGTPAGIMAAVAAARRGSSVALVEYHRHIGGMSTSGLGKSDIENKEAIAGLFREFTQRVHQYYCEEYGRGSINEKLSRNGYYYEPSVAERIFQEMMQEQDIATFLGYQIEGASTQSDKIVAATFTHRRTQDRLRLKGKVFVDATYEGDLFALAGAAYRLGREDKDEFGEPHAGKIFFDHEDHVFLEGSTGKGDNGLPAYTYRLCLTDDPDNSYVLVEPPPGYDRNNYTKYFDDLKEDRLSGPKVIREGHGYYPAHFDTMLRVFSFAKIPNRKYDVNINPRALGFPFPEENRNYVEANWTQRERIFERHRELVLGLLYFVQNDPEVSEEHRRMARQYHLPLDEFVDNRHFPWQLYVREARRLKGKYTLTEKDFALPGAGHRSRVFADSIMAGEFPIDSFPVSKEPSADKKVLEGYICLLEIAPYQVPLRVLLPEKMEQLIVPVAASTSHVAFSTIRMEPMWMGLGQVAGTLASLSIEVERPPSEVPIHLLQRILLENDQILTYFKDLDPADKAVKAAQFWGTRGFFDSYEAQLHESLSSADLNRWVDIVVGVSGKSNDKDLPQVATRNGVVPLSEFSLFVENFSKKMKMQLPSPSEWLYEERELQLPVRRGEACIAFHLLYFQILGWKKAPE